MIASVIRWSLGNAHFTYDLDRKEAVDDSLKAIRAALAGDTAKTEDDKEKKDDGYRPEEHRVLVQYTRDIPNGVVVLRGGRAVVARAGAVARVGGRGDAAERLGDHRQGRRPEAQLLPVEPGKLLGGRAGLAQVPAVVAHRVLEHAAADAEGDGLHGPVVRAVVVGHPSRLRRRPGR